MRLVLPADLVEVEDPGDLGLARVRERGLGGGWTVPAVRRRRLGRRVGAATIGGASMRVGPA